MRFQVDHECLSRMAQICPLCGRKFKRLQKHIQSSPACQRAAIPLRSIVIHKSGGSNKAPGYCSPTAAFAQQQTLLSIKESIVKGAIMKANQLEFHHGILLEETTKPSATNKALRTSKRVATLTQETEQVGNNLSIGNHGNDEDVDFEFDPDLTDYQGGLDIADPSTNRPHENATEEEEVQILPQQDNHADNSVLAQAPALPPPRGGTNTALLHPINKVKAMGMEFNIALGQCRNYTVEEQIGHTTSSISQSDRVLARIHQKCNQVGAPRYLVDDILAILKEETLAHRFNILESSITQRKSLFQRLQDAINVEPVEEIPVLLESGLKTTVYRFNFIDMLQRHLLSSVFADFGELNLPIPDKNAPFNNHSNSVPPFDFSDMTNGEWYQDAIKKYR